ncbi:hypothetical protein CORC01_06671 [Colletotrichum orchidophilum]|uniref:Uncharacterized protein n=1 Tax=Colletotrichum orchidophilum TaxID=1209926 RepID=A0A1G4B9N9_9PEZI|nr:uncharacterized protein CORC01_06671 [Colletotrichum orchidophilum]OHE98002.1 hypothetical protein CORC01_06671 [Colletotrichum orchidophilum]
MGQKREIEELETRLGQYHTRHQKDQNRRIQFKSEFSLLRKQKDEISRDLDQRDGRTQELEQEVANLQAERELQDAEAAKLNNELEATHFKLDKLQERSRGYKDHLNKAIAEHQQLWQQSREIAQKTIDNMRTEHHEVEEKFNSIMAEKTAAQDKLNGISKDRQVLLQGEVATAASKIKDLTSALNNLERDFDFEAQRARELEVKLLEGRDLEGLLLLVDGKVARISEKMDDVQVNSAQKAAIPAEVTQRLNEIADHVQSAPRVNIEDEVRQALKTFQEDMMPRFLEELKIMVTGQSIEEKLQGLQKIFQNQSLSIQAERKDQQERLLMQLSERKEESKKLAQILQSKDAEVANMTNAVSELSRKLQEARNSAESASTKATTTEAELQALQQNLSSKDCQVTEAQAELQLQREGHEIKVRELQEKLRIVEEDVDRQRQLAEESGKNLAKNSKDDHTTMETRLRSSGKSLHQAQQQLSMVEAEVERLRALESVSKASKLEKELENARQRVTNLTLKLRETQVPAATTNIADQVAEQLAYLQTLKGEVKQLRSNGNAYAAVSKDLAQILSRQDATGSDDILVPDSLVVPESEFPLLPPQDVYDPLNDFQPSSSDIPLMQISKRTVFRSPVEELEDETPAPSIEQEKYQRTEVTTQGSRLKSILRPQRTPTTRTSKARNDAMVARHAGHSSYNRPVQSALKSSQEAVLDVKDNFVGNRKANLTDLIGRNEWERLEGPTSFAEQRGIKRTSKSQSWSRGPKRSKPCFTENEDNVETSQFTGSNMGDRRQNESSEHSKKDGKKALQDDDQISYHFLPSASKPNESAERGGK